VSLVLFSDEAAALFGSQAASDKPKLKAKIDRIGIAGGTKMSTGIREGLAEVKKNVAGNRTSRIVLLTDGETFDDEEECRSLAAQCGSAGIPLSPFGIGAEWNQQLLDDVGQKSFGKAAEYIESADRVALAFQQELQSLAGTVVHNAELALREIPVGTAIVKLYRVLPQLVPVTDFDLTEKRATVRLGQMAKDETVGLLFEVSIPSKPAGRFRIGQIEFTYDIPQAGLSRQSVRSDVVVNYTNNQSQCYMDPEVKQFIQDMNVYDRATRALAGDKTVKLGAGETRKLSEATQRLLADVQQDPTKKLSAEEVKGATKDLRGMTQRLTGN
jgi:Ca-activated chloride channel family protein